MKEMSSKPKPMRGFCAPNIKGEFTDADLYVVEAAHFDSAKLMPYHDHNNIAQLQAKGVNRFITRLPDFKPGMNEAAWWDDCWRVVQEVYPHCQTFQTANEPNVPELVGGWGAKAWEFAYYLRRMLITMTNRCAHAGLVTRYGVMQYVLPPLSYAPALWSNLNIWKTAFTQSPDHLGQIAPIAAMCRYAGANCYWEYPKFMLDGSYGMSWGDVHNWSGLDVIVLEYGYSAYLLQQPPTVIQREMARSYPLYMSENEKRGALGSFVFQVGGTLDWAGLAIPMPVALAMGKL